jgi:geranylgeranyl diphosphate synthase type II
MDLDFKAYLSERRQLIDEALESLLPAAEGPAAKLNESMRYAVMAGGKRLRPIIAISCCEAAGGKSGIVIEPAAALELIHTYSLIHDDLPAMDDDDLRRGRPTTHRVYGEAEAILAGDALLTLAFEILGSRPQGERLEGRRSECVAVAARRSGASGMVGGQMADLEAEGRDVDIDALRWIHLHKTGALIAASAEIGAIHAGADGPLRSAFSRFGESIGLAFQVADDILDCTSTAEQLGKTPGKDAKAGKATYPALFGLRASRKRAVELVEEAASHLKPLGLLSEPLEALANYAIARTK